MLCPSCAQMKSLKYENDMLKLKIQQLESCDDGKVHQSTGLWKTKLGWAQEKFSPAIYNLMEPIIEEECKGQRLNDKIKFQILELYLTRCCKIYSFIKSENDKISFLEDIQRSLYNDDRLLDQIAHDKLNVIYEKQQSKNRG